MLLLFRVSNGWRGVNLQALVCGKVLRRKPPARIKRFVIFTSVEKTSVASSNSLAIIVVLFAQSLLFKILPFGVVKSAQTHDVIVTPRDVGLFPLDSVGS